MNHTPSSCSQCGEVEATSRLALKSQETLKSQTLRASPASPGTTKKMQLLRQSLALRPPRVQARAREEGREGVYHRKKFWELDPHFRAALNAV